ncbi:MAG: magnesium-protoporphyrin IX monomethyl ester (oxidative) cyclase, partial [Microcoleaceae cyanobacterium]
MYLNDIQRSDFYACLGLDARAYDKLVIEKTNETAARVFPVMLDVKNPEFYDRLEICIKNNEKLSAIAESNAPGFVKLLQKLPYFISNGLQFLQLYFIKPIDVTNLEGTVR